MAIYVLFYPLRRQDINIDFGCTKIDEWYAQINFKIGFKAF